MDLLEDEPLWSKISKIIQKYWGIDTLRPFQKAAIKAVLENQNVFVLMPTGGGKSLCFQLPALLTPGICIVISPLVALIKDQVEGLKNRGIKAIGLAGFYSFSELDAILDNCIYGAYKFLYLSPERLEQDLVIERLKKMPINLIAIDEAHCISQWGHDFRPSYRKINRLNEIFPKIPKIALTATATPRIFKDIIESLKLDNPKIVRQSFARKNIGYHTIYSEDKGYTTQLILTHNTGPAIVYTTNRNSTQEISSMLNKYGIKATYFHGGLNIDEKEKRLKSWLNEDVRVMVATNAFGMGIDKPNVRVVIHFNIPESIENYCQETGRLGRDGKASKAFLVMNPYDKDHLRNQFLKNLANVDQLKYIYKKLNTYFGVAYGECTQEVYVLNFQDFCKTYKISSQLVYNAFKTLDRFAVIQFSQNFETQTKLQFITSSSDIMTYSSKQPLVKHIVKSILRLYGGVFQQSTSISIEAIAKHSQRHIGEVVQVLESLHKQEIIKYKAQHKDSEIQFLVPREDDRTINVFAKDISEQIKIKTAHVEAILAYAENNSQCKAIQILSYFGEQLTDPCGICSVCAFHKKAFTNKDISKIKHTIYSILKNHPLTSRQLALENKDLEETTILYVLKLLLEESRVAINTKNEYYVCRT